MNLNQLKFLESKSTKESFINESIFDLDSDTITSNEEKLFRNKGFSKIRNRGDLQFTSILDYLNKMSLKKFTSSEQVLVNYTPSLDNLLNYNKINAENILKNKKVQHLINSIDDKTEFEKNLDITYNDNFQYNFLSPHFFNQFVEYSKKSPDFKNQTKAYSISNLPYLTSTTQANPNLKRFNFYNSKTF